jgi:hypothetical protein
LFSALKIAAFGFPKPNLSIQSKMPRTLGNESAGISFPQQSPTLPRNGLQLSLNIGASPDASTDDVLSPLTYPYALSSGHSGSTVVHDPAVAE